MNLTADLIITHSLPCNLLVSRASLTPEIALVTSITRGTPEIPLINHLHYKDIAQHCN